MPTDRPAVWPAAQRYLHGWTAVLVLVAFGTSWIMAALPFTHLLAKFRLYQLHKTLGLIVLVLAGVRLLLRAGWRRPEWDRNLPVLQVRAASLVHTLLYGLLLLVPVLGYFTAATAPIGVPTLFLGLIRVPHLVGPDREWFQILQSVHRVAAIALVVLACGHAAMAVYHHRQGRPTLARMWRSVAVPQLMREPPKP